MCIIFFFSFFFLTVLRRWEMGRLAPSSGHGAVQPHTHSGSWHPHHFDHGGHIRYINILTKVNLHAYCGCHTGSVVKNALCVSASKGLVDAAHFCYLMAQVGFGVYTKKSTKMVLIGSNHRCVMAHRVIRDMHTKMDTKCVIGHIVYLH